MHLYWIQIATFSFLWPAGPLVSISLFDYDKCDFWDNNHYDVFLPSCSSTVVKLITVVFLLLGFPDVESVSNSVGSLSLALCILRWMLLLQCVHDLGLLILVFDCLTSLEPGRFGLVRAVVWFVWLRTLRISFGARKVTSWQSFARRWSRELNSSFWIEILLGLFESSSFWLLPFSCIIQVSIDFSHQKQNPKTLKFVHCYSQIQQLVGLFFNRLLAHHNREVHKAKTFGTS